MKIKQLLSGIIKSIRGKKEKILYSDIKAKIEVELKEPTFNEDGSFTKAQLFEEIWIQDNINHDYWANKKLNDDEYLDYCVWKDINYNELNKKYRPNTRVIRGVNPNIIFHGGCLGCNSQQLHGLERCKGCQYFRANWRKPNLHIEGGESATMSADDLKNLLK